MNYLIEILNNNYLFISIMLAIIVLSTVFNMFSIYKFTQIKKRISPDYIKLQLWIINLVFTIVAIPYFMLKELNYFESRIFECKLLYTITDFIMFVYNNLLTLMAVDRYIFICTHMSQKLNQILIPFYSITFIIASTSVIRLFQNDCSLSILKKSQESFLINSYNYFIIILISISMILTFLIYLKIIIYVYKKETKVRNHIEIKLVDFKQNLNKSNKLAEKQFDTISSIKNKSYIRLFKNTKHWKILIVFLKVIKIISIFFLNYLKILII
jgi:hypothetical protein